MLAARTRSGLVESMHDGAVAVVSPDGDLVAWSGEIDRPFYLRSAAKPFQAWVSQQEGAELGPVALALACASHDGQPVHVSIVEKMLSSVGLGPDHLKCPPAWPLAASARHRLVGSGNTSPRRTWNNCSGKHSAWLRACVAQGLDPSTYLDPDNSIQGKVAEFVTEIGEYSVAPVGVDGCGAPVLRTTVRVMARLYARLASEPALGPIFDVMHRYPSLVSGYGNGDSSIATSANGAAKGGAAGCIGVAIRGRLGVAVKAWDGLNEVAYSAAATTLHQMGELPGIAARSLEPVIRPKTLGGGRQVGVLEPRLELRT